MRVRYHQHKFTAVFSIDDTYRAQLKKLSLKNARIGTSKRPDENVAFKINYYIINTKSICLAILISRSVVIVLYQVPRNIKV